MTDKEKAEMLCKVFDDNELKVLNECITYVDKMLRLADPDWEGTNKARHDVNKILDIINLASKLEKEIIEQ